MSQNNKLTPFNAGDHVRYVAARSHSVPSGQGKELVLAPGMEGVIVMSTGGLSAEGEAAVRPWRCQVQFQNGFQFDITPDNRADFEMTKG